MDVECRVIVNSLTSDVTIIVLQTMRVECWVLINIWTNDNTKLQNLKSWFANSIIIFQTHKSKVNDQEMEFSNHKASNVMLIFLVAHSINLKVIFKHLQWGHLFISIKTLKKTHKLLLLKIWQVLKTQWMKVASCHLILTMCKS